MGKTPSEKENGIHYAVNQPYPPIKVMGQNPHYAKQMLDNVGGDCSEIRAVSLYFYDHLITTECEEIALAFHKISIVEMHHLEIFGRLALLLGADPRLWSAEGSYMKYWNGSQICYYHDLKELLKYAIADETKAIEKYQMQAGIIKDYYVVASLERIIADERLHLQILKELYQKYVVTIPMDISLRI